MGLNVLLLLSRLIFLCSVFAGAAPAARALDPQKAVTQYMHDVWTTEDGLPQSAVHGVVQTPDGLIWFATHDGLVRFDGLRFTVFDSDNIKEMTDNIGHAVLLGGDGNLWLGTNGGLTRYKDGAFTTFTTKDGLSNDEVYGIFGDADGGLWVRATGGGLNHFRDGKFTHHTTLAGASVRRAAVTHRDRRGVFWIGTYNEGLVEIRNDESRVYTTKDGLAADTVTAIYEDRDGNLWFGTPGALNRFEDGRFTARPLEGESPGKSTDAITTIYEDRDGNLWLGTNGGLYRFGGGEFSRYATEQGLTDNEVVSILEDREGSLWVGTHAGGLHRFKDAPMTTYTAADGLVGGNVVAFPEDSRGDLWFGTSDGISRFGGGRFTAYTTKDGLPNDRIVRIYEDRRGRIWVSTYGGGLSQFRDGRFESDAEKNKTLRAYVFAMHEDRAGNFWVGAFRRGLVRFKGGQEATTYTIKEGLPDDRVMNIYEDREGGLWFGTFGGGVAHFRDEKFTVYGTKDGLVHESVAAIYEDEDGALWVGTGGGLSRFKDGKFVSVTMRDGLFDNEVYGIAEDGRGDFWMTSNKGVFRVARRELNDFADGKLNRVTSVSYGAADGMRTRECNGGGYRTRDGRIWFLTVKGVAVVDPARLRLNEVVPPVVIERAVADGETIATGGRAELAPGKQNFEFHYAGLSFVAPEKVRYKYKLEGLDRDWTDAGARRTAYYTNIPPGSYRFRVIAANNDGVWNEEGAAFDLRLRPHFYQTRWFYVLCVLLLVSLAAAAYLLRVARLKRLQRRLVGMVEERTQELHEEKEKLSEAYRLIEADNERKTRELEEARVLQLSMLPKQLPALPNLEVAAYMKPASEVGGDYYDFHVGDDGTLTVAVGDATGHGLRAGTMVTATKSLFETLAGEPDIPRIFEQSNQVLKQMNLRALYMALMVLKVKDNQLRVCAAGMPPLLIHRAATGAVEEVALKAMPLGSVRNYSYRQREVNLAAGDTVVLMSDGFPERFNEAGEMFDYERAKGVLEEVAARGADEIIDHFVRTGERWGGGRPQDDDVTFVVLKIKSDGHRAAPPDS